MLTFRYRRTTITPDNEVIVHENLELPQFHQEHGIVVCSGHDMLKLVNIWNMSFTGALVGKKVNAYHYDLLV